MEILNLKNVGLTYFSNNGENEALKDISFKVMEGEFISIVGPSGCGKTTLLSVIAGLMPTTKGEVSLCGKPVNLKDNNIGYMFQKDHLFEWRTVLKNIYLGLEIQNKKSEENNKYVSNLLKKYGLWEYKDKYPSELSGGMRQRVALIRTLALKPKLLLLDEAFSALDYQTRINICNDVANILKNEKVTSLLVTHDLIEAITMSDRIIVLSKVPATVKSEHIVNINKNLTPLEKRDSDETKALFKEIWKELQQ